MPDITFNFSITATTGENVGAVLADLAHRLDGFGATGARPANLSVLGSVSDKQADELVRRMTDFARNAMRYICESGPTVEVGKVIEHTGVKDGFTLGGYMSSLGFALKKVGLVNPLPLVGEHYEVDMAVASELLAALDRYDKEHS